MENDAAIFDLTAEELRKRGCLVKEYPESALEENAVEESLIFHMARDSRSVRKLQTYENEGRLVVNSPRGIQNCTRESMTRLLLANHVPHPKSLIVPTDINPLPLLREAGMQRCWIKRGDFHAVCREDVAYVRDREEAPDILRGYALRGIKQAVINEHLRGDLVKFYGVLGTRFFHWFYPLPAHHSKFGLEQINGTAKGFPFAPEKLRSLCNRTARILNTQVYGGDCIVSPEGLVDIIDFNDWPSFAPCRKEAARYIAKRIYTLISTSCETQHPIVR